MNQVHQNQGQSKPPSSPQPPQPEYRFRWSLVLVLLTILAFFWLLNGLDASLKFEDVLEYLGVRQHDRYIRLACLAVVLIAVTLIAKPPRNKSK